MDSGQRTKPAAESLVFFFALCRPPSCAFVVITASYSLFAKSSKVFSAPGNSPHTCAHSACTWKYRHPRHPATASAPVLPRWPQFMKLVQQRADEQGDRREGAMQRNETKQIKLLETGARVAVGRANERSQADMKPL